LAFLKRWPDPLKLRRASKSALVNFFCKQNSRSEKLIGERIKLIAEAGCLTEDPSLLEVARMSIADRIAQIQTLN
jgi:hypothetical protein